MPTLAGGFGGVWRRWLWRRRRLQHRRRLLSQGRRYARPSGEGGLANTHPSDSMASTAMALGRYRAVPGHGRGLRTEVGTRLLRHGAATDPSPESAPLLEHVLLAGAQVRGWGSRRPSSRLVAGDAWLGSRMPPACSLCCIARTVHRTGGVDRSPRGIGPAPCEQGLRIDPEQSSGGAES